MTRPKRRPRPAYRQPSEPAPVVRDPRREEAGNRHILITALFLLSGVLVLFILLLLLRKPFSPPQLKNGLEAWPLSEITGPGTGDAPLFVRPLGIAWGPDSQIYVSDTGNSRICVFTSGGQFVREFGRIRSSPTAPYTYQLMQPAGLTISNDGSVYVADVRGGDVVVFDAQGRLVRRIQLKVPAHAARWTPTDVVLFGGEVYVSDAAGVQVFSAKGKPVRRFNVAFKGSPFSHPNGVAVRADGSVIVSDTNNARVVAMRPNGGLLWLVGSSSRQAGVVGLPRGITLASNGSILIADAFLFDVLRISSAGDYVESYGARGSQPGQFEYPNDVDARGELLLVADKENNRVQVIRYPALITPSASR